MANIPDLTSNATVRNIEKLMTELLPDDFDSWCWGRQNPKIIHDALWGTFRLEPHEVALIDTPLFQRLAFVHQTGAVSLTYRSARHTRFEHVLGVMHQASKMCQALRSRDEHRFGSGVERQVRFAGLLHDIGHGPFSHTSEQYFSKDASISKIQKNKYYRDSGAGEMLSSLMILSRRFRDFVNTINSAYKIELDVEQASNMITGNMENQKMYLGEFVHGPFDADKLDYMHRDGMFSGLKLQIDLDRLYTSIEVLDAKDSEGDRYQRLAGSLAGVSPLTQIMFNKILLFTGMYHHHKVRAVDCMLWAIFELAESTKSKVGGYLLNSPINFLRMTDDAVLTSALTNNSDIKGLIGDIRQRRLWKRALVISRQTVDPNIISSNKNSDSSPLTQFKEVGGNEPEDILKRRLIAGEIWKQAGKPCKQHEIWIDIPSAPSMTESKRMWIRDNGMKDPITLGDYMPIQHWVDYYGTYRWKAHVYCPEYSRDAVNKASIRVLESMFNLKLTDLATSQANLNR